MAKTGQKSLVIVESPAKAKTINKYLGADFEVKASMGHVRDLPSKGLNVDLENDFAPTYDITPGRKKIVAALKASAKSCRNLYLATDLDREGEAIAWHLAEVLGVPEEKIFRVVFNAITKNDIQQAFSSPAKLNMDRVMAQQARRILDRIVGYQISPLLWKKVAKGLSAGRVQSVAVRMIVEKEREIRAFTPTEYWLIPAVFTVDLKNDYLAEWRKFIASAKDPKKGRALAEQYAWLKKHNAFKADMYTIDGKKFHAPDEKTAADIFAAMKNADFKVARLNVKRVSSRPSPPFITSTLQQAAANRLGFGAQRTMRIAQDLYEGIDMGSMGALGLITYMRTDSTHLSQEALSGARDYIAGNLGSEYLPAGPVFYAAAKSAQQAHEAIRPTDCDLTPDDIRKFLTDDQYKLYDLIWRRFVACQMAEAQWDTTTVEIEAPTSIGPCAFRGAGRVLVFDGFTRVWHTASDDQFLPAMKTNDAVRTVDMRPLQHFTKPPARYTEASLVKALEKEGIGRPSTYASIISTIQERNYVEKVDRNFRPTAVGEVVTDKLCEFFPRVMDIAFTRHMEGQLDKIEEQHLDWLGVLREFYGPFKDSLDKAAEEMKHARAETAPSDYDCPACGAKLVYRFGRNGRFLSCSAYPECKFASPCDSEDRMITEQPTEHQCPNCGKPMLQKSGRFGPFLGCSDYPTCKTIMRVDKEGKVLPPKPPAEPTGVKCHKCSKGELVIRQGKKGPFLGCNKFPRCRTIVSMKQLDQLKQLQAEGKWPPPDKEQADALLGKAKTGRKARRTGGKKSADK